MTTTLQFLGAADTVTGSRYLVTTADARVLVDCGLFQGLKVLRERNRRPLPFAPADLDAVVVTHAHLDHSGYLPALVRDGYAGAVFCTPGTEELCGILLPDSGYLLEEEARYAGKHGTSRHANPAPLYTVNDALVALDQFVSIPFDEARGVARGVTATLLPAGHIVGAAQVRLKAADRTVTFSGDLGRWDDPLMRAPRALGETDVLVVESTYGDRDHPAESPERALGEIVRRVCGRGGVVMIPAFAVGRTESLLLHLSRLRERGEIPDVPIYVNSPMASNAARIYRAFPEEHRVSDEELERLYSLPHYVRSVEESKELNLRSGPMVIISASGMITGGRILHHLAAFGGDPANAVVLAGFQAAGTRGAALARGERSLRIFGRDVAIEAEVVSLPSMSAHADADAVMRWLAAAPQAPTMTYVTHGEPSAADALRLRIKHELGWAVRVPDQGEIVELA
ncbi:MBL fold metallo-hydrolase [Leifsonia sp. H3M29-4]|uniref:MBL fold metallo-hydrolase RNA specificity domain-containing protein n=1 Tax=Salinibacterium metalliresistens TaxID=3031321 RepID=UPI0023D9C9FF|nr:MBL fold metallo-hydrolase [Salinibacterium metalliresistens]MDF1480217.1 MBL fold metallo-hydrolase [Salinibacterium metalliresistens]